MNENYEKFRHQLMMKLMDNGVGDVEKILKLTDIVSKDYKIELVETLPAIYEGGVPEEFKEYLVEKKLQGYSQDLLKNELYVFTNFFNAMGTVP